MMKKRLCALLLAAAMVLGTVPAPVFAQDANTPDYGTPGVDYVEGEVIACVKGGAAGLKTTGLQTASATDATDLMDVSDQAKGLTALSADESPEKALVLVTGGDTKTMIAELESNPAVEYAEPNYIYQLADLGTPTDPDYQYQWGLKNNETPGRATGADLNATSACSRPATAPPWWLWWTAAWIIITRI